MSSTNERPDQTTLKVEDTISQQETSDSAPRELKTNETSTDPTPTPEPPFSAFSTNEKWALVAFAGISGFFSPISASIYFPAIPLLANDFGTSVSLMNLTVTVYFIFQGCGPVFWAPWADTKGRRPVFILCLTLLVLASMALALTPSDKWWLLLVFRCFQAAGGAPTIALGAGVVGDIATPAERGGFIGWAVLGGVLGPCIGPVIGGLIAGNLGWRWIFWFICIATGVWLTIKILLFPETLRRIVGDGSIRPPRWNRPVIPLIAPYRRKAQGAGTAASQPQKSGRTNPLLFFREPDIVFLLLANGFAYLLLAAIQTSTSLVLQRNYPSLTQTEIGLCFVPFGLGCMISSVVTGRLLNWQYRKDRAIWEQKQRRKREAAKMKDVDSPWTAEEEDTFRIELTRVRWAMSFTISGIAFTIGYGWALDKSVNLAVPLIFQFFAGYVLLGQLNSCQTLLVDAFPKQGSSTTALNNLVRCSFGALVSSVINLIIDAMGVGWTFTLLSLIVLLFAPTLTLLVIHKGPDWRKARTLRSGKTQQGIP